VQYGADGGESHPHVRAGRSAVDVRQTRSASVVQQFGGRGTHRSQGVGLDIRGVEQRRVAPPVSRMRDSSSRVAGLTGSNKSG
jgi:hypothetical protein